MEIDISELKKSLQGLKKNFDDNSRNLSRVFSNTTNALSNNFRTLNNLDLSVNTKGLQASLEGLQKNFDSTSKAINASTEAMAESLNTSSDLTGATGDIFFSTVKVQERVKEILAQIREIAAEIAAEREDDNRNAAAMEPWNLPELPSSTLISELIKNLYPGSKPWVNVIDSLLNLDSGGIIPGSFSQPVPIMAHGSEMVLNPVQQANLFNMLNNQPAKKGDQNYMYAPQVKAGVSAREVFDVLERHNRQFFSFVSEGVQKDSSLRNAVKSV